MHTLHNPPDVVKAFGAYSQGVEVPTGARRLYVSGQLGVAADDSAPDDFEGQCEQAFKNIFGILEAAGMKLENLVKMTAFLTRQADFPAYRVIRDRMMNGVMVASTALVVAGLAAPKWLIEIEAIAAKT